VSICPGRAIKSCAIVALVAAIFAVPQSASGSDAYRPAVAQWTDNRVDVFVRGSDNDVYHRLYDNGWSIWESLGSPPGGTDRAPGAMQAGIGLYSVFVKGAQGGLYHKYFDPGQRGWIGWGLIPNTGNIDSTPAVTYGTDAYPDVFYRGTDGHIYHVYYHPTLGWLGPYLLGGDVIGAPAATTTGNGTINVIVRGLDNAIYHKYALGSGGWTTWGGVPNAVTTHAPAAHGNQNAVSVYYRGTDGRLWHTYWTASTGWVRGQIPNTSPASGPAASSPQTGNINYMNTFYRGSDGNYYHTYWTPNSGWVGPGSISDPIKDFEWYVAQMGQFSGTPTVSQGPERSPTAEDTAGWPSTDLASAAAGEWRCRPVYVNNSPYPQGNHWAEINWCWNRYKQKVRKGGKNRTWWEWSGSNNIPYNAEIVDRQYEDWFDPSDAAIVRGQTATLRLCTQIKLFCQSYNDLFRIRGYYNGAYRWRVNGVTGRVGLIPDPPD
jgi:hypothetical protein